MAKNTEKSGNHQIDGIVGLYGPAVRVVPILCGPFARATQLGGRPEEDEGVRRVLDALREIADAHRERLVWIAGVDMAHIGRRYGDAFAVRADDGAMVDVAVQETDRGGRVFENCDIRAMLKRIHPSTG